LVPPKGKFKAKSSPKSSTIKAATTIPNTHNTLGMGLSSISRLQVETMRFSQQRDAFPMKRKPSSL
jgi:hypothetical protein